MTSEATKQLRRPFLKVIFEISDINYICCHFSATKSNIHTQETKYDI